MFVHYILAIFLAHSSAEEPPAPTKRAILHDQIHVVKRGVSICGYGIEDPSYSFVCGGGDVCGFNSASEAFGCCDGSAGTSAYDCYFPTVCYDYGKLSINPTGSNAAYTTSCSDISYPYCAMIYENGMSNFDCNEYPSQTQHLNFLANTTAIITSSISDTLSSSRSNTVSSSQTNTFQSSNNLNTAVNTIPAVVGPTSTAPTFSMSQASGSVAPTTAKSNGSNLEMMNLWSYAMIVILGMISGSIY